MHGLAGRFHALSVLTIALALSAFAHASAIHEGTQFFEGELTEAAELAARDERLLVIVGSATWCAPCHQMADRSWPHGRVASWIAEHAVAVKLDVDSFPQRATQLRLGAIPAVLMLRDGRELGRHVGMLSALDLLQWLESTSATQPADDAPRFQFDELNEPFKDKGISARDAEADRLLAEGRVEEAFEAYVWLWQEGALYEPGYRGVRRSYLASELAKLVQVHPPAREAFYTILDRTEERLRSDDVAETDWEDFCVLTGRVLDDPDRLLELYAEWVLEDGSADAMHPIAQAAVFQQLYRSGSYAAAARATPRLLERATRQLESMHTRIDQYARLREPSLLDYAYSSTAESLAQLHAAAIAGDREGVAREIGDVLREHVNDEIALTALVEEALSTDTARAMHHEWLADTGEWWVAIDDLRERLSEAYRPPPELDRATASSPPGSADFDPSVAEVVEAVETLFDRDAGLFSALGKRRRFANWGDDAVPALRVLLADSFADDNEFALFEALRQCGTESCLDLVIDALAGRTQVDADSFHWHLDQLTSSSEVRALLHERPEFKSLMFELATSNSAYDQRHFCGVAGAMAWPDSQPHLEHMLEDPDAALREAAAVALGRLTGEAVTARKAQRSVPAERLQAGLLGEPIQLSVSRDEPAHFTSSEPIAVVQPLTASFVRDANGDSALAVSLGAGYRTLDAQGALTPLVRLPSFATSMRSHEPGPGQALQTLVLASGAPTLSAQELLALDANGALLWRWRSDDGSISDAAPVFTETGAAGVVVAANSELVGLDLQGQVRWRREAFTPAYELATHARLPGLVLTVFGDLKVFDVEENRLSDSPRELSAPAYVTSMELFPAADGTPALVVSGSGEQGMFVLARLDLTGRVAWQAEIPERVQSLALLETEHDERLIAVATAALELLIFDEHGTLLNVTDLPDPNFGGRSGPITLSAGTLADGRSALAVKLMTFGYLYPLDLSVLDGR
ncbi:MAG: hypothetical protein DHS20C15_04520 [Planctomycetota bacterium]|nr:MAG: hypothetical protein DHS20C15_04520 [Planctomycetota bacterium]